MRFCGTSNASIQPPPQHFWLWSIYVYIDRMEPDILHSCIQIRTTWLFHAQITFSIASAFGSRIIHTQMPYMQWHPRADSWWPTISFSSVYIVYTADRPSYRVYRSDGAPRVRLNKFDLSRALSSQRESTTSYIPKGVSPRGSYIYIAQCDHGDHTYHHMGNDEIALQWV